MKHQIIEFCFTLIVMLGITNVKAECDYKKQYELSQVASNVKANYVVSAEPELFFTVNVYNVSEDIYLKVTDSITGVTKTYYNDSDNKGVITFNSYTIYEKVNYNIGVYSIDTECPTQSLRTINITTPRYNPNYSSKLCQDNHEFSLCSKWYDFDISHEELKSKLDEYNKKEKEEKKDGNNEMKKSFFDNFFEFLKNYYIFIIIFIILITLSFTFIISKKRKYEAKK